MPSLKKLQYMSLLCSEGKIHYDKIPKINTTDEDFYKFLEQGAAEFFEKCSWMGNIYPCYEIFQPIVTDEGLCMTFNMLNKDDLFRDVVDPPPIQHKLHLYNAQKPEDWTVGYGYGDLADVETFPRRALLAGSMNALIVNLNVSLEDLDYACTSFQGFQVVLHKAVRFPTVQQHYFRVPLRKSVIVAISPTQLITSDNVKAYSVAKRRCYFQSEKRLKYFKHYTQYNCKLECLTKLTLKKCGCVAFYMPNNLDMDGLEHSINRENNKEDIGDARPKCECIPMCASVEYNVEITEIDYEWYKEFDALGYAKLDDDELYAKSQLVIYFKSSHFIPYERNELYGHLDFLANIGGLLGLFVGFSLLSFFEIIYFLSLRIICNLKLYKNWYGKENK
ncbi:hypothetical protein NQ318_023056 [Aromia moschata]|uniref:Uncharacterized protein n=1 Tax=Aromia moschata TaxID=1265417 RepID=A0AAV8XZ10_9CUCU|nr:hypothetical protein NQ318_023056 [Aromia moschata]